MYFKTIYAKEKKRRVMPGGWLLCTARTFAPCHHIRTRANRKIHTHKHTHTQLNSCSAKGVHLAPWRDANHYIHNTNFVERARKQRGRRRKVPLVADIYIWFICIDYIYIYDVRYFNALSMQTSHPHIYIYWLCIWLTSAVAIFAQSQWIAAIVYILY